MWDSEQRTTLQSGLYSDTDCGCRWQATLRLGFVFYTEKSSTPSVLAVLVLCLRSLAFVTVSTRPLRVCPDLATAVTRYGTSCVQEPSTSETAADVRIQFSIARLSNLTKRPRSLPGGWRHTETPAIVVRPRPSKSVPFFPKYLRQTPLDRHRLPTDAGFKSSLRPLSGTLALWKQNQHCDEKGVSSRKDFRWFFCPDEEENN